MNLSQSIDRTSSHSASFYLLFLTLGIFTAKGLIKKKIIIIIIIISVKLPSSCVASSQFTWMEISMIWTWRKHLLFFVVKAVIFHIDVVKSRNYLLVRKSTIASKLYICCIVYCRSRTWGRLHCSYWSCLTLKTHESGNVWRLYFTGFMGNFSIFERSFASRLTTYSWGMSDTVDVYNSTCIVHSVIYRRAVRKSQWKFCKVTAEFFKSCWKLHWKYTSVWLKGVSEKEYISTPISLDSCQEGEPLIQFLFSAKYRKRFWRGIENDTGHLWIWRKLLTECPERCYTGV